MGQCDAIYDDPDKPHTQGISGDASGAAARSLTKDAQHEVLVGFSVFLPGGCVSQFSADLERRGRFGCRILTNHLPPTTWR